MMTDTTGKNVNEVAEIKTEWSEEMKNVSSQIKKSLLSYYALNVKNKKSGILLDVCNNLRSLLAICNFGDESCMNLSDDEKASVKDMLNTVIGYVSEDNENGGFDLSPKISQDDCADIFYDENDNSVPVTFTMATVFTTIVYLRRAIKRREIITVDEINEGREGLYDNCVKTLRRIAIKFVEYVENNGYKGWGFTLKSKKITLNDTYAVVDAISRFQDAFNSSDESKRDEEFLDCFNAGGDKFGKTLVSRLEEAMYRVAVNIYDRASENYYGVNLFYADGLDFALTDIKQIQSSNRSSALFNPLYVAMITMMGYTDKETVIRAFMDENDNVIKYRDTFGEELEEYARSVADKIGYNGNFKEDVEALCKPHEPLYGEYNDREKRDKYYLVARIFEKFLSSRHKEELMKIPQYRNYLNATKDAIDQVQVGYRKFNDMQRLGVVDTDYVMFTTDDIKTDSVNISKLNKANLAVSNIRPLLLSSKIMIVNALTQYPQADMTDIYEDIKKSIHRQRGRNSKKSDWLWNEDEIDLYSTARHCEAIAYDYFDYYDRYELGFKAINSLVGTVEQEITEKIDYADGSLGETERDVSEDDTVIRKLVLEKNGSNTLKNLVMDITRDNLSKIQDRYKIRLQQITEEYEAKIAAEREEKENLVQEMKKREESAAKAVAALDEDVAVSKMMKSVIEKEISSYFKKLLSFIVLSKINNRSVDFDSVYDDDAEVFLKGDNATVKKFVDGVKISGANSNDKEAAIEKAREEFADVKRDAEELRPLIELAFDGVLEANERVNVGCKGDIGDKDGNVAVQEEYETMKKEVRSFMIMWRKNKDADKDNSLKNVFAACKDHDVDIMKAKDVNEENNK